MLLKYSIFLLQLLIAFASSADLPTLYEYYTADGVTSGLSVDQPYFTLNGKNFSIYSGAMHFFRVPPEHWRDRLRKLRATGLNTVETYVPWNLHEPRNGTFDFGNGGTEMQNFVDIGRFLTIAKEEDLFVIVRPGPYICAEWEWGGFPSWLLREESIVVRTSDPVYMGYVERYFNQLLPLLAQQQFTQGGPIIMVQVENEYGYSPRIDLDYLQQLHDLMIDNGIVELLVTSDGAGSRQAGTLPGVLFQTVNFGSDPAASFEILESIQPGKPLMNMEFYPAWFDHWSETHHTQSAATFQSVYEQVIAYPASINLYMFHGGTNWGFLNGANNGPGDNSGFQPTTTSYDYDAPLSEAGDYTEKYYIIRDLMKQYNTIPVATPDPPELVERQAYPTITIDGQISYNGILQNSGDPVSSPIPLSMELLSVNNENGQSYGYIAYHQNDVNIPANSNLTITGHLHDTLMVLVNGELISKPLTSSDDFNGFGYWRLENQSITLTTTDLTNATLDLVIENWGRVNFGNMLYQYKGLTKDNHVYLNDEELLAFIIYPMQFGGSWITQISNWSPADELVKGPGFYKATLTVDAGLPNTDTFIDMRGWSKGVVIINGFKLGQYAFIGPQQTLYLPGGLLHEGDNEIIIFEQFQPASEIKFSKDPIFSNP